MPRPRRYERLERRIGRQSGFPRTCERSVHPDNSERRPRRPRHSRLAKLFSWPGDDGSGDLRRRGLAVRPSRTARQLSKRRNKPSMTDQDQKSDCPFKKLALTKDAPAKPLSRRNLLLKVGTGLNGIAAALIGVPLLGYVLSSFTR